MAETSFHEVLVTLREAAPAHASALNALEGAITAQTVKLAEGRRALEVERDAVARDRADLKVERKAVARDRSNLEAELARIWAVQLPTDERIKLNVGGVWYETSRATLTGIPESMLATMFGRRADMLQRDPDDGSVFIDRDGERFGLILDFMRDRDASRVAEVIKALPEARQQVMVHELDFFGLKDVVFPPWPWFEEAAFAVGPETDQQRRFCAAVLHGRRAVVFGGQDGDYKTLASTEVLDLDTMTIGPGPDMSTERTQCSAVVLDARRALVVGGFSNGPLQTTEILDLETMVFSAGPEMLTPRSGCAAVALDARYILVAGGTDGEVYLKTTEILDQKTMSFASGPDMVSGRFGCAGVALDAHRVLFIGGEDDDFALERTEVLDVRMMAFAPGPSMRSKRRLCAAIPLDTRHRLVIGGCDSTSRLKTTAILDIEAMEFREGPDMDEARGGPGAVVDGERVLVFGGSASAMSEILSVVQEEEGASAAPTLTLDHTPVPIVAP